MLSKLFDCFLFPIDFAFSKTKATQLRNDTTVHLLFDLSREFSVPLSDALKDFKILLQKPLQLLGLDPREISTSNSNQQESAKIIIDLILLAFKIKEVISDEFFGAVGPRRRVSNGTEVDLNAVISELSTNQLNLSTALAAKRSAKYQNVVPAIYRNLEHLLHCIFQQFGRYFADNFENDHAIIFPKIPFAENLLVDLAIIHSLLRHNFTSLDGKFFFKWTDSTKEQMVAIDEDDFERFGIIVTEDSFDMIKHYYENFNENIFWALNLESNFNNIEPLLFINNQEVSFGFADTPMVDGPTSRLDEKVGDGNELYFVSCSCSNPHFRFWMCKGCWNLFKIGDADNVLCGCGCQKVTELERECFQCMFISKRTPRATSDGFEFKDSTYLKGDYPVETKPRKPLKRVEIVPPDPHNSSKNSPKMAEAAAPPPPPAPPIQASVPSQSPPPPPPIVATPLSPPIGDITAALEQLHERVKVATELCDDVLQKVTKKDGDEPPIEIQHPELVAAVQEPPGEPLDALKQKVEEALEYVEEIKEAEESRTNSSA